MKRRHFLVAIAIAGTVNVAHAADPADARKFGSREPTQDAIITSTDKTFTFSGYMRAGTGINLRGGSQVCFKLPGADTKYRLGNECDYDIEPHFVGKLTSYEGSDWYVRVNPGVYRAWGESEFVTHQSPNGSAPNTPNSDSDTLVARFNQAYVYGTKISSLGMGTVWAGRRFYNRLHLGINDQYVENNDGDGAGIEDMKTRYGLLSVAFMMNGRGDANKFAAFAKSGRGEPNDNRYQLPLRLTGIKNIRSGELSIYFTLSGQLKSRDQSFATDPEKSSSGVALGLYQTLKKTVFGGNTLLGFRYDEDHEFDIIDAIGTTAPTENTRFLIQHSGSWSRATTYDLLAQYRLKTRQGRDSDWFSIGGRTDTHISGPYRVLVEVGHDQVKPDGAASQRMTKFTVAGAMSAGKNSWSRPTLRLFVTHAVWNEAARLVLNEGWVNEARLKQVYGDKKAGTSVGIQAETWW